MALVTEGSAFVMKQIKGTIVAFAPVLNCELTAFREVLLTQRPNEVDSDEDEMDDDVYEEGFEHDGMEGHDICSDDITESKDIVLEVKLIVDSIEPVVAEDLRPVVSCWRLPSAMSQGFYKRCNGSNACSLILLLIGNVFCKTKIQLPTKQSVLPKDITIVCGCMELGNRVYELCGHNLPSRYLSVQEASSVLETWLRCVFGDVLPIRLEDAHEQSIINGELRQAMASHDSSYAFLIMNEKTSVFLLFSSAVVYIGTHSHRSSGAVVVFSMIPHIQDFCEAVWDLEGYNEKTFGDLVFGLGLNFPYWEM